MTEFTERIMIIATDRDGFDVTTYIFEFLTKKNINIEEAVKKAVYDFCQTEEGKAVYSGNCHNFNWGDFDTYVTDGFCSKHGFIKANTVIDIVTVDFNQQLIDDCDVHFDE